MLNGCGVSAMAAAKPRAEKVRRKRLSLGCAIFSCCGRDTPLPGNRNNRRKTPSDVTDSTVIVP